MCAGASANALRRTHGLANPSDECSQGRSGDAGSDDDLSNEMSDLYSRAALANPAMSAYVE